MIVGRTLVGGCSTDLVLMIDGLVKFNKATSVSTVRNQREIKEYSKLKLRRINFYLYSLGGAVGHRSVHNA